MNGGNGHPNCMTMCFGDESRFCMQYQNDWVLDWRDFGERLINCYVMHCHTVPAGGHMM